MSTTTKIVIAALVVIALGGAWGYFMQGPVADPLAQAPTSPQQENRPTASVTETPSVVPKVTGNTTITISDNSDASIDHDAAAIDSQMNGLSDDNAKADSGLSSE